MKKLLSPAKTLAFLTAFSALTACHKNDLGYNFDCGEYQTGRNGNEGEGPDTLVVFNGGKHTLYGYTDCFAVLKDINKEDSMAYVLTVPFKVNAGDTASILVAGLPANSQVILSKTFTADNKDMNNECLGDDLDAFSNRGPYCDPNYNNGGGRNPDQP